MNNPVTESPRKIPALRLSKEKRQEVSRMAMIVFVVGLVEFFLR